MSAAYVTREGDTTSLDGRAPNPSVVTAEDVQDPEKLARLLEDAHRKIQALERRWNPRVLYFRDLVVDNTLTTQFPLEHKFGGRVNFDVVHWQPANPGDVPQIEPDASATTADTLVLISGAIGTATIRVEEAG